MTGWFKVDREGLRKIIERRGKSIILSELLQNAFDENSTTVDVVLEKIAGRPFAHLVVKDDNPSGFDDLSHAYTMFAESKKKGDPSKRGFMDIGEKLVLSLCKNAKIISTKGSVHFLEDDTMKIGRQKTDRGSVFEAEVRLNQEEFDEVIESFWRLIPPPQCETVLNGKKLPNRIPLDTFETSLQTTIADENGGMKKTFRKTIVEIHEPKEEEVAHIYEMGIPVVETGDKYHYNVMQRVPINMERDNVPPSYLTKLRAVVLNHMAEKLSPQETAETWVTNALESEDVQKEAISETLDKRFGKKRASFDPTDLQANMNLTAKGYTVISGRTLPKRAWENIRKAEAIASSGKIAPTPKPYSNHPDADPVRVIPKKEWNTGMIEIEDIARQMARFLLKKDDLLVRYVRPSQKHWSACWYGGMDFNVTRLGLEYFETWKKHPTHILDLILHEFAHHYASNHLEDKFYKACTDLGARCAKILCQGKIPTLSHALKEA